MKVDPEFKHLIVPLSEKEKAMLEESIKRDGCRVPLDVWKEEDILLDGHNRKDICDKTGTEFKINYVSIPDRTAAKIWILENQSGRRNLNKSQLAALALDLEEQYAIRAKERQSAAGGDRKSESYQESVKAHGPEAVDRKQASDEAAKVYSVAPRQVRRAKAVKTHGVPELMDEVKSGNVTVRTAENVSRLPHDVQKTVISKGPETMKRVSTVMNDLSPVEKINPGVTERAVSKVVSGEAASPKEAIEKTLPDEDLRRFREFDRKTNAAVNEAVRKVGNSFNGSDKACFMPNVKELWCNCCGWGFDVFLPIPGSSISCPYCRGQNLTKRDKEWYPGR